MKFWTSILFEADIFRFKYRMLEIYKQTQFRHQDEIISLFKAIKSDTSSNKFPFSRIFYKGLIEEG